MGVQKVQTDRQKIKFPSKVTKFAKRVRIDPIKIFHINIFFCLTLSFLVNFSNDGVQIFTKCFGEDFRGEKIPLLSKWLTVSVR